MLSYYEVGIDDLIKLLIMNNFTLFQAYQDLSSKELFPLTYFPFVLQSVRDLTL